MDYVTVTSVPAPLDNPQLPMPDTTPPSFLSILAEPAWTAPGIISVAIPMLVTTIVLIRLARGPGWSIPLTLVWLMSLPAMYLASFWREAGEVLMLQIVPVFSIAVMIMVWRRIAIAPATAYALSFLSLFAIDVLRAVEFAYQRYLPLADFLHGVGGAGITDGLFVFPLMTAGFVMYGNWRHATVQRQSQGGPALATRASHP